MTPRLLPGMLDAAQVSLLTGYSIDALYEHADDEGGWPVHRVGRRVRWSTRPLLKDLGLTEVVAAALLGMDAEADPTAPGTSSGALADGGADQGTNPRHPGTRSQRKPVGRPHDAVDGRARDVEVDW